MAGPFYGYDIAIAIVGIMISIAGIILGLGYAIDDRKIKELGRSELYQAIINAAIIAVLFVSFSQNGLFTLIINGITSNITQQSCTPSLGYNSAICFAYNYLVGSAAITINGSTYPSLSTSTIGILAPLTLLYVALGTLSSIQVSAIIISIGLSGLNVFLNPLKGVIDLLVANLFLIGAQAALLNFIALTAIPAILPVGLILRTFYFTRKLGGALIAIAIGFFAVFPMTYVLDAQLMNTYANGSVGQIFDSATASIINASSSVSSISSGAYGISETFASKNYNAINFNPVAVIGDYVSVFASAFSAMMQLIQTAVTFLIIQVFILPTFSLVLTVISVRELARIFGSEISFGRFDIF